MERTNTVHFEDERLFHDIREAFGIHEDDVISMYDEFDGGYHEFHVSADHQENVDFIAFRVYFNE